MSFEVRRLQQERQDAISEVASLEREVDNVKERLGEAEAKSTF